VEDYITPQSPNTLLARLKANQWFHFERNELLILIAVFALSSSYANFSPYAPVWLKGLFDVNSYLVLGLISVITNAMIVLGTPLWGRLADRFNLKFFVILGTSSLGLMYLLLIFSTSHTYFLVLILIGNLFGAAQTGNMYALATLNINKSKEHVLAKLSINMSLAWLIVSPIAGYIYNTQNNSFTIQLSIAVFSCFCSIIALLFVKEKKKERKQENNTTETHKSVPMTNEIGLFSLVVILSFIFQAASGGFWSFNSLYFIDALNISSQYYSIFLITTTTLAIPVSILLSKVKTRKKTGILILIFTGLQILIFLLMTLFPTKGAFNLALYSLPMYPIYTISIYSLITSLSNVERRATAYGVFNAIGILGIIVGTLFLGYYADKSPIGLYIMLRLTLYLSIAAFCIALILVMMLSRKHAEIYFRKQDSKCKELIKK